MQSSSLDSLITLKNIDYTLSLIIFYMRLLLKFDKIHPNTENVQIIFQLEINKNVYFYSHLAKLDILIEALLPSSKNKSSTTVFHFFYLSV